MEEINRLSITHIFTPLQVLHMLFSNKTEHITSLVYLGK